LDEIHEKSLIALGEEWRCVLKQRTNDELVELEVEEGHRIVVQVVVELNRV
jgi:hypothetical protein